MWAAASSQGPMMRELLAHGAEVDAKSATDLMTPLVSGEPRAQPRPPGGMTAMLFATREGCMDCVKALVEKGAKLDLPDPEGVTPLISAIFNAHFDVAKYLIEKGANIDRWDWWGRSPLYLAVDYNTLPHGGRPDQPSLDETLPIDIVRILLEKGANPNLQLKLFPPYRATGADRGVDGMLTVGTTPLLRAAKGAGCSRDQAAAGARRHRRSAEQPGHDADGGGFRHGLGGCRHARLLTTLRYSGARHCVAGVAARARRRIERTGGPLAASAPARSRVLGLE